MFVLGYMHQSFPCIDVGVILDIKRQTLDENQNVITITEQWKVINLEIIAAGKFFQVQIKNTKSGKVENITAVYKE